MEKRFKKVFFGYLSLGLITIVIFSLTTDREMIFECHKETMTCAYSKSTIFNKELHPVKTYDISRIKDLSVSRHESFRLYKAKSVYYHAVIETDKEAFSV